MLSLTTKTAWSVARHRARSLGDSSPASSSPLLGPNGAGQLAYFLWIAEATGCCVNFGLQSSLTRFVAQLHGEGRFLKSHRWLGGSFCAPRDGNGERWSLVPLVCCDTERWSVYQWLLVAVLFMAQGMGAIYQAASTAAALC